EPDGGGVRRRIATPAPRLGEAITMFVTWSRFPANHGDARRCWARRPLADTEMRHKATSRRRQCTDRVGLPRSPLFLNEPHARPAVSDIARFEEQQPRFIESPLKRLKRACSGVDPTALDFFNGDLRDAGRFGQVRLLPVE